MGQFSDRHQKQGTHNYEILPPESPLYGYMSPGVVAERPNFNDPDQIFSPGQLEPGMSIQHVHVAASKDGDKVVGDIYAVVAVGYRYDHYNWLSLQQALDTPLVEDPNGAILCRETEYGFRINNIFLADWGLIPSVSGWNSTNYTRVAKPEASEPTQE